MGATIFRSSFAIKYGAPACTPALALFSISIRSHSLIHHGNTRAASSAMRSLQSLPMSLAMQLTVRRWSVLHGSQRVTWRTMSARRPLGPWLVSVRGWTPWRCVLASSLFTPFRKSKYGAAAQPAPQQTFCIATIDLSLPPVCTAAPDVTVFKGAQSCQGPKHREIAILVVTILWLLLKGAQPLHTWPDFELLRHIGAPHYDVRVHYQDERLLWL